MAKNSKVQNVGLEVEIGHHDDRVLVTFTRHYLTYPRLHQLKGHSYHLRSRESSLRVWEIVNNPETKHSDIDLGHFGYLYAGFDVSQL